ncbi:adenylate/guanylate cyclase domain-containing protein [Hoyosella sp. YIM 151337]|uniref:adenylate/guanylate cyclase domain-containing protein n=1 Tax=Hoyosella sp. YIM 151337 TaxID=2992742 RepID=UPI0022363E3F|nr:adenylate/guanylate cyclase domain-containing protein [Hoyosella sp. YIM 151337]MCW4355854.1 adenylate/guanylate cyclase domain-containing protein [Hoyosella sp. YIM 151337]
MTRPVRLPELPESFVPIFNQFLKPITLAYAAALVFTNSIGAVMSFVLLRYVLPHPANAEITPEIRSSNTVLLSTVLPLSIAFGITISAWAGRPIFRWMEQGGMPNPRQHALIVSAPARQTALIAALWVLVTTTFAISVTRVGSPQLVLMVTLTFLSVGLTCCAISYFVAERILRRLISDAMHGVSVESRSATSVTMRLVTMWIITAALPLFWIALVVGFRFLSSIFPDTNQTATAVAILGILTIVVGFLGMAVVARSISDPVKQVSAAMEAVKGGRYDISVPIYDGSEIGRLQYGFNQMVHGLAERERLSDMFGRRVGTDVVREVLDRGGSLGGESRYVAVMFVDLVGSSRRIEALPPYRVVAMLNEFFEVVVDTVHTHGGIVNKFTGDAALAVFGAPVSLPNVASAALAAARELRPRIQATTTLNFGVGVSAGYVVAGNVGARNRLEYTVIGDPVNEAARLKELAKAWPGRVLASFDVLQKADAHESARWLPTTSVTLRGRIAPTRLAVPR